MCNLINIHTYIYKYILVHIYDIHTYRHTDIIQTYIHTLSNNCTISRESVSFVASDQRFS